jgi:hypothetical protein
MTDNVVTGITFGGTGPTDPIYREIGRFIFQFSQLEYTLRHHVAEMAHIGDEYFDIVASAFDFAKLCSALLALSAKEKCGKADPALKNLISECHDVNTVRIRVVHGLWVVGSGNDRAIHTSRNSMKSDVYFDKPGDLEAQTDRCAKLRFEIEKTIYAMPSFERPS